MVQRVEIRVEGCLDPQWSEWFDGLNIIRANQGETRITGMVGDQAALYGLIGKLRDIGMKLISVNIEDINALW
jgi:hypothetical protein